MDDEPGGVTFAVLNEIAIIAQLSRALFEARLPAGIGVPQFGVVNHLFRLGDGRTPLELARAFQVPKTSMTHTIQVLERAGYISVAPNPADKRSKCVWLTDAGSDFRGQVIAALGPDIAQAEAVLDPDRLRSILPELRRLREYLDESRP